MRYTTFFCILALAISSARAEEQSAAFLLLPGLWGGSQDACASNPHHISFARDGDVVTMVVSYASVGAATRGDIRESFVYDIIGYSDFSLLVELRQENRFDFFGKPVQWQIALIDEDTYCWHREDWEDGACTVPRVRCGF